MSHDYIFIIYNINDGPVLHYFICINPVGTLPHKKRAELLITGSQPGSNPLRACFITNSTSYAHCPMRLHGPV